MRIFGKITIAALLTVNLIVAILLIAVAYSIYLNPDEFPRLACLGLTFPIFLLLNFCFLIFWLLIRSRFALLPLLGFLICLPQVRTYIPINFRSEEKPQNAIKILSYNVMAFNDLKKTNGESAILNYLRDSNADIICIQEYSEKSTHKYATKRHIAKAMKAYPYKQVHRIGREGQYNQIACFSKYPIISAKRLDYKSQSNGSVIYEIVLKGDTLTLVNNHLESNKLTTTDKEIYEEMLRNPETKKMKRGAASLLRKLSEAQRIRAVQARAIHEAVKASRHSCIVVCGDFNDSPISYTHRVISENLNDAFVSSGSGLGISYNQNKFYFRIDHILISGNIKSSYCTVDHSIKNSDHYPIWCYLE